MGRLRDVTVDGWMSPANPVMMHASMRGQGGQGQRYKDRNEQRWTKDAERESV